MTANDEVEQLARLLHQCSNSVEAFDQISVGEHDHYIASAEDIIAAGYSKQSTSSGLRGLDEKEILNVKNAVINEFLFLVKDHDYCKLGLTMMKEKACDVIEKELKKFGTNQQMPTEEGIADIVKPWCKDFRYEIAKAVLALIERKRKE